MSPAVYKWAIRHGVTMAALNELQALFGMHGGHDLPRPITPMEAWQELGVYRPAARVSDLKEAGHDIAKETVSVANRFGEECRVARYRLVK